MLIRNNIGISMDNSKQEKFLIEALPKYDLEDNSIEPNVYIEGCSFIGIPQNEKCYLSLRQVKNGSFDIEMKNLLICPAICRPILAPNFVIWILKKLGFVYGSYKKHPS